MRVEMLQDRMYRGEALDAGRVTDMDEQTARWFIGSGWAREAVEPAPLTAEEADALIPVKIRKGRALR